MNAAIRLLRCCRIEYLILAKDLQAFTARYPAADAPAGVYGDSLDDNGERIALVDRFGDTIFDFHYGDADAWPSRADGDGATLELRDAASVPATEPERTAYLEDPDQWRSSGLYGGSPRSDGSGPLAEVLVNEVLTHTDPPQVDAIELYNTTADDLEIGGWYLSDTSDNLRKFRIPDDTTLPRRRLSGVRRERLQRRRGRRPEQRSLRAGQRGRRRRLADAGRRLHADLLRGSRVVCRRRQRRVVRTLAQRRGRPVPHDPQHAERGQQRATRRTGDHQRGALQPRPGPRRRRPGVRRDLQPGRRDGRFDRLADSQGGRIRLCPRHDARSAVGVGRAVVRPGQTGQRRPRGGLPAGILRSTSRSCWSAASGANWTTAARRCSCSGPTIRRPARWIPST